MNHIIALFGTLLWVYGIVVVKGFWWTLLALFPIAGWYFVVQHIVTINGWI